MDNLKLDSTSSKISFASSHVFELCWKMAIYGRPMQTLKSIV